MSGKRRRREETRRREAEQTLGSSADTGALAAVGMPERAESEWSELVLICQECADKQRKAGVDGEGTSLLHWLKKRLRLDGRRKQYRVVETSCLDICPKQGTAIAKGSELNGHHGVRVLNSNDNPESVVHWLYGAGATTGRTEVSES